MRFTGSAVVLIFGLQTLCAGPITLMPGSLLVQAPTQAITTANIVSYTKTGSVLGTGQITGTGDLAESLTVLNGNVFVSDGAGRVNRIDLTTGAVVSYFNTNTVGLEGLGSLNGNLLALSFSSTAISIYSTAGLLQRSVNLMSLPNSFSWTGLASDGSFFYLDDYDSGRIYEYSMTGVQLGYITTGLTNGLIGLSYDASNNSLWITDASFSGPNQVIDFSTTGIELGEFSTGSFKPAGGIAVVPVSTPEPGGAFLLFVALMLAFGTRNLSKSGDHKVRCTRGTTNTF